MLDHTHSPTPAVICRNILHQLEVGTTYGWCCMIWQSVSQFLQDVCFVSLNLCASLFRCYSVTEWLMECLSYLAVHRASWFLMPMVSAVGSSSLTKVTSQCGGNLFRTVTCTSTKVRVVHKLISTDCYFEFVDDNVWWWWWWWPTCESFSQSQFTHLWLTRCS